MADSEKKEGKMKIQKSQEWKELFSFWRAIIWWKIKIWQKIADTSFKAVLDNLDCLSTMLSNIQD